MVAGKDEVNLILITYLCMERCGLSTLSEDVAKRKMYKLNSCANTYSYSYSRIAFFTVVEIIRMLFPWCG